MSTAARLPDRPRLPALVPDRLRPPSLLDPTAPAYKDWLHLNVVDHRSGIAGLVNLSLHGSPGDARSRCVGGALFHVPGVGWGGNLAVRGVAEARIGASSVVLDAAALAVDHAAGTVSASALFPDDALELRLVAAAAEPATAVELPLPLGSGWVSWYVVPRLSVAGWLRLGDRRVDLSGADAYHDHNWGRWHWGDDLGWDWGCFLAPAPGPAIVLARTSDRARRRVGPSTVLVRVGGLRRLLAGATVRVTSQGRLDARPRRVPGALAALHAGRSAPALPRTVRVAADDGRDRVELAFTAEHAAQLIVADPARRGYGFIHELTGRFRCHGTVGGRRVEAEGLGVVEQVD